MCFPVKEEGKAVGLLDVTLDVALGDFGWVVWMGCSDGLFGPHFLDGSLNLLLACSFGFPFFGFGFGCFLFLFLFLFLFCFCFLFFVFCGFCVSCTPQAQPFLFFEVSSALQSSIVCS